MDTRIEDLFPELSKEEREQAIEALDDYLRLAIEIYETYVDGEAGKPYDESGRPFSSPKLNNNL